MVSKIQIPVIFSVYLFVAASIANAQPATIFDIRGYGAVADGETDISQAVTQAWKEACALKTPSAIFIPEGTYAMNTVKLEGPCSSSMHLRVEGILTAPADPGAMQGADGWVTISRIDSFTMDGGGTFDGQGQMAWTQNTCKKNADCPQAPMNLRFDFVSNGLVTDITSLNSKNFHINVLGCRNFAFKRFTVSAPADSANTDGIHIGRSVGVSISDTRIATGDDCISLGDGCQVVNITRVTCGPGHGISVGSLGKYPNEEPVAGIFVTDSTLIGTDNGVRIKSWPNKYSNMASNMHFENILMKDVGSPILIDQVYCPWNQCNKQAPSKVKISDVSFKNIRGTSTTQVAVQLSCSGGLPCEGVELGGIDLKYTGTQGPTTAQCTNVRPTITGQFMPASAGGGGGCGGGGGAV